jgi:hypothetical protein
MDSTTPLRLLQTVRLNGRLTWPSCSTGNRTALLKNAALLFESLHCFCCSCTLGNEGSKG